MADRQVPPDFNPKYRIVGAIVLVALLVVLVPMILDEREPPPELQRGRDAASGAETPPTKIVVTPVPPEAPKPATPEPPPPPKAEAKPAPEKPAPKPEPVKPKAAKIEDGWMVQVGTFTHIENATRLREKLKKLGHTVHTDSVSVGGKKALRLRVGPFAERAKADQAQAQIRKETGVAGVVQSPG